ncbi:MAG: four helix bundle protein [Verrucomicrobiales bacterium]
MGEVKSFRDLIVWQKSMDLVTDIYKISREFPDAEKFGLSNQMRRAVVSVPSNIAEGYGRGSTNEYLRFLHIASGSLYEVQTQLQIAENLAYVSADARTPIESLATECEKMLGSLISTLKAKLPPTS